MRLTRRGKIVVTIGFLILVLAGLGAAGFFDGDPVWYNCTGDTCS